MEMLLLSQKVGCGPVPTQKKAEDFLDDTHHHQLYGNLLPDQSFTILVCNSTKASQQSLYKCVAKDTGVKDIVIRFSGHPNDVNISEKTMPINWIKNQSIFIFGHTITVQEDRGCTMKLLF